MRKNSVRILLSVVCLVIGFNANAAKNVGNFTCWWEQYDLPMSVGGGYFLMQWCVTSGGGSPEYAGCLDFPIVGPPACP